MFTKRKVPDWFASVVLIVIHSSRSSSVRALDLDPIAYEPIKVAMCASLSGREGYKESLEFCKCETNVVSCDFSGFKSQKPTSAELEALWSQDTVKRICICGAPSNLELYLGEQFLNGFTGVNRVDLYNIDGPVKIDYAFPLYFAGDMYMSGLRLIRQMSKFEYGRGYPIQLNDTTHLSCCSKIATPKFSSPTFFMEHSTVDSVQNAGLNDRHLWKNLIFQNVTFNRMEPHAIGLIDKDQNVSFTNCQFHNLGNAAISVRDVKNLLVAHSTFHRTCHHLPIGARSISRNSTIALIENEFHMPIVLGVDAKAVAVWFNAFNTWNNETFVFLNATTHEDRVVSIEFNTVEKFELKSADIPTLKPSDRVTFNENIIIPCNCGTVARLSLPGLLQKSTQRCYFHDVTETCHLNLTEVSEACRNDPKGNFAGMCLTGKGSAPFFNAKTFEDVEYFLRATSMYIESEFMDQMAEEEGRNRTVMEIPDEARTNLTTTEIPPKVTGTDSSAAVSNVQSQMLFFGFGLTHLFRINII